MPKNFHRNWLPMLGFLSGIVWQLELPGRFWCIPCVLLLLSYLGCRHCRREIVLTLLGIWLGISCTCLRQYRDVRLRRSQLCSVTMEITDENAIGPALHPGELPPESVRARICSGLPDQEVLLRFPPSLPNPGLVQGKRYAVTGRLNPVRFPTDFCIASADGRTWRKMPEPYHARGYADYLAAQGIFSSLKVQELQPLPDAMGFWAGLRRYLTGNLDRGIENQEHRAILSAMTIGLRSRLGSQEKALFRRAGTIHLFSVSGLHVGIIAALFFLLLRPLPMAWHLLLLWVLFGYVWLTGSNAPALRAFALVLGVEFLRMQALWIRPLELLGLIGCSILLVQPHYLTDAGFQYSFLITGFLILATPAAQEIAKNASGAEIAYGTPSILRRRFCIWRGRVLATAFLTVIAGISGMAVGLFHQNYFFIGAILVNFMIIPILPLIFTLALLKSLLPFASMIWNVPLKLSLEYLSGCLDFFDRFTQNNTLLIPSCGSAMLFGLLLALAILWRQSRKMLPVLAGLLVWIACRWWIAPMLPGALVVISGGSIAHPMAAMLDRGSHRMSVLNANYSGTFVLRTLAQSQGIATIDQLVLDTPVQDTVSGLPILSQTFPIASLHIPNRPIRSAGFRQAMEASQAIPQKDAQPGLLTFFKDRKHAIEIDTGPDGSYQILVDKVQKYRIVRSSELKISWIPLE